MSIFFSKFSFIQDLIMLYVKFQPSTMSGSGQQVCCGGLVGVGGVETNYSVKLWLKMNNSYYCKRNIYMVKE